MFLWPLKLFPALRGGAQIVYYSAKAFVWLALTPFFLLGDAVESLGKKFATGSDLQTTLEATWKQFEDQRRQLEESLTKIETRDAKVGRALERCRARSGKSGDRTILLSRFRELEEMLTAELQNTEDEHLRVQEALAFFGEREGQLVEMRELLDIYADVHSARLNTDADRQKMLSMIFATQAACAELFRKASDAERKVMVNLDMDLDLIATATAENETMADAVEHKLLV